MKKILVVVGLVSTLCFGQKESDFYKETNHLVSKTVDLVKDYKAKPNDGKDDSEKLQKAIDDMSKQKNGGKIIIPKGVFMLTNIKLKSNVHIEISPKAIIKPTTGSGTIFHLGLAAKGKLALETIKNVSIRSTNGKKYLVDMTAGSYRNKIAFVSCQNVKNFLVSDFNIKDNYSVLSSMLFNISKHNGQFFRPVNGVIKNGHTTGGHYGYGLIQAHAGIHILFKDLSGEGGVTLRLETGSSFLVDAPQTMNLDSIYGRNISIKNGHGGVLMGAHTRQNGYVNIDGVMAMSSTFAASMGTGFTTSTEKKKGHTPGGFSGTSIVKNVHAVFGIKAQLKHKNFKILPCELHPLISVKVNPDLMSYNGPSIVASINKNPEVQFINITQEGFEFQPKAILVKEKKYKCNNTPNVEPSMNLQSFKDLDKAEAKYLKEREKRKL
ncbi:glycoside hydrolase family protein [Lutibacter citreus]|uniref:glycosyl hydrolase family 28-related protein n=1 Tax=Lutibacter citreus TaxID=2138210 RepID=UPI000DBE8430|nr:glycosyl hydrolase family 28-related protein [Lutibacter citreus]